MTHSRGLWIGLAILFVGSLPNRAADKPKEDDPKPDEMRFIDQGAINKALAGYRTPAGIKIEIAADRAAVVNPIGLAFGEDGTAFVIEHRMAADDRWRDEMLEIVYKDKSKRTFHARTKKTRDVIKSLVASKPGGQWDGSRIVLQVEQPSGLLYHDGWLYVAAKGSVHRYKPTKPGGKFDNKQLVAQGFSAYGLGQVSGLAIGPAGMLYISSGAEDHYVEGSDGSRATVMRTGAIFRCRPDGSKLHTYAIGFRNPYRQPAFDVAGHLFHADGGVRENGKSLGYRLVYAAEGSDFGFRLAPGSRNFPDMKRSSLGGDVPGKMPPLYAANTGSAAGLLIYNDTILPESLRGLVLAPDPDGQVIRAFRVEQKGAGFITSRPFDMVAAPKDKQFRPRQIAIGPDGAIYIVDERRATGAAANKNGRIYRLTWSGTKDDPAIGPRGMDSWSKVIAGADGDLVKSLAHDDATIREAARKEFVRRGEKIRPRLLELVGDPEGSTLAKISAIGALQSMFNADVQKVLLKQIANGDDEVRRLAADVLARCAKQGDADVHTALLKVLSVEDRDVRRSFMIALGRLGAPGTADSLVAALSFEKSKDRFLSDGIVRALEMLGKPGIDALLGLADSGVQKDTDLVAATFLELKIKPALDAIPVLLRNPHLSGTQRESLLRSCLNYQFAEPLTLDPIVTQVASDTKETPAVKKALMEVIAAAGVKASPKIASFVTTGVASKDFDLRLAAIDTAGRLGVVKASTTLVEALNGDVEEAERLAIVRALRTAGEKKKSVWSMVQKQIREDSAVLNTEVLRTLSALDQATALVEAVRYLDSKDKTLQRVAVEVHGLSADGAKKVAKLWLDGKLPEELRPRILAGLTSHVGKDDDCARLLAAIKKGKGKP